MTHKACSAFIAVLSVVAFVGCAANKNLNRTTTVPIDINPSIQVESLPQASVTAYTRERLGHLIATRLQLSQQTSAPAPSARPLTAKITLSHYDVFPTRLALDSDPHNRLRIDGVLDLIDQNTDEILLSERVVRIYRLRRYGDLSGFNVRRSHLSRRRHVYLSGLNDVPSKIRLLERAFAGAVVRHLLSATNFSQTEAPSSNSFRNN